MADEDIWIAENEQLESPRRSVQETLTWPERTSMWFALWSPGPCEIDINP
jgi:hypothetical protein